jgi:hypothetical protein
METHAHHLHEAPGKKWTHYLFEFFMLFLAVFCGFLAENFREHQVEHQREKQYMISMTEDLKADTILLSNNIRSRQQRDVMLDSLMLVLSSGNTNENGNSTYYYSRFVSVPIYFFPNDRTIQQLKSTGSLRLISNMQVSDGIMAYDRKMRQQIFEYTDEQQVRGEYRQMAAKIFKGEVFNEMTRHGGMDKPSNNPQLFTSDPALVNQFVVEAQYLRKVDQNQVSRAEELTAQAQELMGLIKREYHLE